MSVYLTFWIGDVRIKDLTTGIKLSYNKRNESQRKYSCEENCTRIQHMKCNLL